MKILTQGNSDIQTKFLCECGTNDINVIFRHYSVNACLAPVCSMHGLAVTTVEGIGSTKTGLHPVQVNTWASNLSNTE